MKVTAILKNLTDAFYRGNGGSIKGLLNMSDSEKFDHLTKHCRDLQVKIKIGAGTIQDAVELNNMLRSNHSISFRIDSRKGYKLATFDITN